MTVVRSAHGVDAVRRVSCVSNNITVHRLEVDVLPGPAWAQVGSASHARLSIVLEAVGGGRVESRLRRDQAPADGPFTMNFAPPGAEVWGSRARRTRPPRAAIARNRACHSESPQPSHWPAPPRTLH